MRERWLNALAAVHTKYPFRMLGLVLVLTVVFGILASQLQYTMRWSDMLPSGDPRTLEYNKIIEEFVSASNNFSDFKDCRKTR